MQAGDYRGASPDGLKAIEGHGGRPERLGKALSAPADADVTSPDQGPRGKGKRTWLRAARASTRTRGHQGSSARSPFVLIRFTDCATAPSTIRLRPNRGSASPADKERVGSRAAKPAGQDVHTLDAASLYVALESARPAAAARRRRRGVPFRESRRSPSRSGAGQEHRTQARPALRLSGT